MAQSYAIIKHQIFSEIADETILKFLPNDPVPNYKIFDIRKEIIAMENIHLLDSYEYRVFQKNIIDNEVKPYCNSHPDCKVLYFGTASIPLALHLGYCFGSWKDVDIYLLHREKMIWNWQNDNNLNMLSHEANFVKEEFTGSINVIYKVEATYLLQDDDLKEVVEEPFKKIELRLDNIGKDVFQSQAQLKYFAHQFSLGIDSIANYLPNADRIHIFPTVPVGLAFLFGTKINPLITKPVVAYQYNVNTTPKYEKILILQESVQPEINISEDDSKYILEIRHELKNELENKIAPFASAKFEEKKKYSEQLNWIHSVLSNGHYNEIERSYWKNIPDISQTILRTSKLDDRTDSASGGFYISEKNEWQINDRFIFNIMNRLNNNMEKILRALRLFIFHEAIHIYQKLTNHTAEYIGRFPRVLEEADYIADVWAMVNEYGYSKIYYASETKDDVDFFKNLISIATDTMWAFDDLDQNIDEMQVRRVNRYLIWYWNYLQIEDRKNSGIEDIIDTLAIKPVLEMRGLDIRAQSQRTIFRLANYKSENLELAYLERGGRILRTSNSGGLQISDLVKGFRERNGDKIIKQLKSWYDQIRDN